MRAIIVAVLLVVCSPPVFSEEKLDVDSMEHRFRIYYNFSSGKVLDVDSISGWSLAYSETLHTVADNLLIGRDPKDQSVGERLLRFGGSAVLMALLEIPASATTHEYGHFRMDSIAGMYKPRFGSDRDEDYEFISTPFNAYTLLFEAAATGGFNTYHATQDPRETTKLEGDSKRAPYRSRFDIMSEAGGLNTSQYTAEVVMSRVLDGYAHPLDIVTYNSYSLATVVYVEGEGGDIGDYADLLEKEGINASHSEIRIISQIPKVLGNSSVSLFLGAIDYVVTGDRQVEPLGIEIGPAKVLWPDFASYLTLNGPTVKLIEQVNVGGQRFYLTAERPFPKNVIEGGLGWRGDVCKYFGAEAYLVHNFDSGGNWAEVAIAVRPCEWFGFGVKGYYGDGYTFRREVAGTSADFMEERESGLKGFVEINLKF